MIKLRLTAPAGLIFFFIASTCTADWSGNITLEGRHFSGEAASARQSNNNISLSAEPEFFYQFPDSRDNIVFTSFARIDQTDSERSHVDIRELYWQKIARDWELTLGINKIFWGVTETIHLVDIINQTDSVENIDGEDKLGQLMAQFSLIQDWGVIDFFILPGFRERTFPGEDGRPRFTPFIIDTDRALYESSDENKHIDYAVRWSNSIGIWDIGVSHFSGTSREPRFIPDFSNPQQPVLLPLYELIDQTGVDVQATLEAWLLKLEAIQRSGQSESFAAAAAGFEYTFVGVFGSSADIGMVTEYLYDERDSQPLNDDLAIGARIALNDVQSTEILVAVLTDLDNQSNSYFVEASRRIGNAYTLGIELRGATNIATGDPVSALRQDRFLQIDFSYFF